MKLYHNSEPEGWQIPGQQDRKAERVDVPSSPAELAAWLNARDVSPRSTSRPVATELEQLEQFEAGGRLLDNAPSVDELLGAADRAEREARPRAPGFCNACGQSSGGKLKLSQGADVETVIAWMMGAEDWQLVRIGEAINEHARELKNVERLQ